MMATTSRPSTGQSAGGGGGSGGDDEAAATTTGIFFPGENDGDAESEATGLFGRDEEEVEQGTEAADGSGSGTASARASSHDGNGGGGAGAAISLRGSSSAASEISGIFGVVACDNGKRGGLTIEEVFDDEEEAQTEERRRPGRQQQQRRPSNTNNNTSTPTPVVSVEAFFRTWLSTSGLTKTLEALQRETADRLKQQQRRGSGGGSNAPQALPATPPPTLEQQLAGALSELSHERARFAREARGLSQEKAALTATVARLQAKCEQQAPALAELRRRFEAATREAALARLERDRALREGGGVVAVPASSSTAAAASRRRAPAQQQPAPAPSSSSPPATTALALARRRSSPLPPPAPATDHNAFGPLGATLPAADVAAFKPLRVCRPPPLRRSDGDGSGGQGPKQAGIAAVALHPGRPLLATASDDGAWRLWQPETGALVMAGEGHKEWVCAVDFMASCSSAFSSSSSAPPQQTPLLLATASGDGSVKLWEPAKRRCAATLHEHAQAVWAARFHPRGGPWLATASLDRTVRLWDCEAVAGVGAGASSSASSSSSSSSLSRSRLVLRGHAGSVNDVSWDPRGGFVLATASNDRTVCVWDARAGGARPVATLGGGGGDGGGGGWAAPVTSVSWSPGASSLLACTDAAGTLRLLDLRAAADAAVATAGASASSSSSELVSCRAGGGGARSAAFDASGAVVAVACDDGRVRCYAVDGRAGGGQAAGALLAEMDARAAVVAASTGEEAPAPLSVSSVAFDRWAHGGVVGGGGNSSPSKLLVAGLSDGSWVGWGLSG